MARALVFIASCFLFSILAVNPSFAVSCSQDGSIEFNESEGSFIGCAGGQEVKLGSYSSLGGCSNKGEIEWSSGAGQFELCDGSFSYSMKCGIAGDPCVQEGAMRYNFSTDIFEACDGTNWNSMHFTTCAVDFDVSWIAGGGSSGGILLSDDGLEWVQVPAPVGMTNVYGVEYGQGKWVVTGSDASNNGVVAYSTDGINWTEVDVSSINTERVQNVKYGGGTWVASMGNNGGPTIISNDAINWRTPTTSPSGYSKSHSYARGVWINSGFDVYKSSDGGENWTNVNNAGDGTGANVFGNGTWVVAGDRDDDGYFYSKDLGDTWTSFDPIEADSSTGLYSIIFSNDNFYISEQDRKIWYGSDVDTFFNKHDTSAIIAGLSFSNNLWVASRYNAGVSYSLDDDLSTLTTTLDNNRWMTKIKYGGHHNDPGEFTFPDVTDVSMSTPVQSTSITISASLTTTQSVYAGNGAEVRVNGGAWVAGDGSATVTGGDTLEISMTSAVGSLKEKVSTIQVGTYTTHWGVTTEEVIVSFMKRSSSTYHISEDSINWSAIPKPESLTGTINDVYFYEDKWMLVSNNADYVYSSDGFNWTRVDLSSIFSAGDRIKVVYQEGLWVAHEYADTVNNTIAVSSDGINWVQKTDIPAKNPHINVFNGKIAVQGRGRVYVSWNQGDSWRFELNHGFGNSYSTYYSNGYLISISPAGNNSYYSINEGDTWKSFRFSTSGNTSDRINNMMYGQGYFAVKRGGTNDIFYKNSTDLNEGNWNNWSTMDLPGADSQWSGTYNSSNWSLINGTYYLRSGSTRYTKDSFFGAVTTTGDGIWGIYGGVHNWPGSFSFTNQTDVNLATAIESDVITINTSMTSTQKVYAGNGAEVRVNGGAWVAGDGSATITAGDTLQVRLTSSSSPLTDKVTTIKVGTHVTHWSVTTEDYIVSWAQGLDNAKIQVSNNGEDFVEVDVSAHVSATTTTIRNIAYGNGLWVAVGDEETILKSTDGFDWQEVTVPASLQLHNLTALEFSSASNVWYIGGRQYAGGSTTANHLVAFNADLSASEDLGQISTHGIYGIVPVNGQVYVSANYGRLFVGNDTSTLSNINLTQSAFSNPIDIDLFNFSNGVWHASTEMPSSTRVRTESLSPVDVSWTTYTLDDHGGYNYSIITGGNKVIHAYQNSNRVTYFEDVSTTQYVRSGSDHIGGGSTFGNGSWLINGHGARYELWDDDLVNVTTAYASENTNGGDYGGIHNDPGSFVFNNVSETALATVVESNIITIDAFMTSTQKVYAGNGAEVSVNGGAWVAGDGTAEVTGGDTLRVRMTSALASEESKTSTIQVGSHKTHWTVTTEEFLVSWVVPAIEGGEYYLAVAEERPSSAADFIRVPTESFFGSNRAQTVAYGNDVWVAARVGTIIYSEDGLQWQQSPNTAGSIERIIYWPEKQIFIADKSTGNTLYSTDGINWAEGNGGTRYSKGATTSKEYAFLGNQSGQPVKRSTDGINWSDIPAGLTGRGNGPIYGDGTLVFDNGLNSILYSENEGQSVNDVSISLNYFAEMEFGGGYFVRVRRNSSGQPIGYATADQLKRNDWDSITAPFGGWHGRIMWGNGEWLQYGHSGAIAQYDHTDLINDIGGTRVYDVDDTGWGSYGGVHNDPGYFIFNDITNTTPNTVVETSTITVGNVSNTLYVYAGNGAEVQVNGGAWLAGTGSATVVTGDTFKVRMNASNYGALRKKVSTIQVGTQTAHWQVTNMDFDNTPDAVSFTNVVEVSPSTLQESNIIQITGIDHPVAVSVNSGSEYRTCSDTNCSSVISDWSNYNGYVDVSDYLQVRHTTPLSGETSTTSVLNIGDVSKTWMSTTYDNTPDAANDFTDSFDVSISTLVESDIIEVTDIYNGISITVTGDTGSEYRICSDASCTTTITDWGSSEVTISNGNYIQVRHISAAGGPAETQTTVSFGGRDIDWIATTEAYALSPFGFNPSVWYDGKDIDADGTYAGMSEAGLSGSSVATWQDKGLYNNDISQTTSSAQPTYNGENVVFDGSNDFLAAGYNSRIQDPSGTTVFVVTSLNGFSNYGAVINMRTGGGYNIYESNNDTWDLWTRRLDGNWNILSGPSAKPETTFLSFTAENGAQNWYVNNVQQDSSTVAWQPASEGTLLCVGAGSHLCDDHRLEGEINEILIFDGVLSSASRTAVHNYLLDQWQELEIPNVDTAATNTLITSDAITYRGAGTQTVNVTGGAEVQVNGGSWVGTGVATIQSGDSLRLRVTSASTAPTAVSVDVTIGAKSTTWNVKTMDSVVYAPSIWLDAFDFDGDGIQEGASESVISSGRITTWVDKGVYGLDATQTVTTAQPTYDGFGATFDGSNDYMQVSYDERLQNEDAYTFFLVSQVDGNAGSYRTPFSIRNDSNPDTGFNMYAGSTDEWEFWTGEGSGFDIDGTGDSVVNGKIEIFHGALDGSSKNLYKDDILTSSGGALLKNELPTALCIGSINAGSECSTTNLMHNGKVFEVLVYDSILSAASRTEIYNYLNSKWRDTSVDTIDFTDASDVSPSIYIESDIQQVTGISNVVDINVSGGQQSEYRICSDASCTSVVQNWTSVAGAVDNNQYIQLRTLSAPNDDISDAISSLSPRNWYRFDETSGSTLNDYGSVGIDGAYNSGTFTLGVAGMTAEGNLAVDLDSNYDVQAPATAIDWVNGVGNYSIVSLFNADIVNGSPDAIFSTRGGATTDARFSVFIYSGGDLHIDQGDARRNTGLNVTAGRDYAFFLSKNGTSMQAELYDINAATSQVDTWTSTESTVQSHTYPLTFGKLNVGYGQHLDGIIDEFAMFDSTLSTTEMNNIKYSILKSLSRTVTLILAGTVNVDWAVDTKL